MFFICFFFFCRGLKEMEGMMDTLGRVCNLLRLGYWLLGFQAAKLTLSVHGPPPPPSSSSGGS